MTWAGSAERRARGADPTTIVLIVLGLVVAPIGLGLAPGGWTTVPVPFWLVMGALHLCYALTCRRLAVAYRGQDPYRQGGRRMWSMCGLGGLVFLAGDGYQVFFSIRYPPGRDTIMGGQVETALVAVAMALLLVGFLGFPSGPGSAEDRSRLRMDVATVMAGATTCGTLLCQLPDGQSGWHWVLAFAGALLIQPGLFLVGLFALVKLFLGERTPFTRPAAVLSGLAAVVQVSVQAVPDSGYLASRQGAWMMAGNVLGSALLAVGTQLQWRRVRQDSRRLGRRRSRTYSWLPYGALTLTWALTVGVLIVQGLTWRSWAVGGGAMITTGLVVARQLAAFRHVEELLRERDVLAARLTEQAYHDALTGLANRALFMSRLTQSLGRGPVTVFLVDLDHFKPVNDSFGHATGDQLLIEVSARLRRLVRVGDTAARLGGDEFAVLAVGLDRDSQADMADRLSHALAGTVRLGDADVRLGASIGMATSRPGVRDADTVLHEADMAMYAVKNAARTHRTAFETVLR